MLLLIYIELLYIVYYIYCNIYYIRTSSNFTSICAGRTAEHNVLQLQKGCSCNAVLYVVAKKSNWFVLWYARIVKTGRALMFWYKRALITNKGGFVLFRRSVMRYIAIDAIYLHPKWRWRRSRRRRRKRGKTRIRSRRTKKNLKLPNQANELHHFFLFTSRLCFATLKISVILQ